LAKTGHDVTIVCGSDLGFPENSYMKQGVVLTEIPYHHSRPIHALSKQSEEYFFKQAVKKWMSKNQEQFDMVKEESQKYTFTAYDKYRKQYSVL
jgi:hypothetical protein